MVDRANKHLQHTAQRFEDEAALMSSCFFTLEDDVVEQERRAARMHLMRNEQAIAHVVQLKAVAAAEAREREKEDEEVLDTVIETQALLQQTVRVALLCAAIFAVVIGVWTCWLGSAQVLLHFGSNAENGEVPPLDRLNRRMGRIQEKHQAAAEAAAVALAAEKELAEVAVKEEEERAVQAAAVAAAPAKKPVSKKK